MTPQYHMEIGNSRNRGIGFYLFCELKLGDTKTACPPYFYIILTSSLEYLAQRPQKII